MVENVFYLPGLGRLIFQSISNRDLIVVRNCVMLLAAMVIVVNFVVDVLYAVIDPRVKASDLSHEPVESSSTMTPTSASTATASQGRCLRRVRPRGQQGWHRALRHRSFVLGAVLTMLMLGMAAISLVWTPWSPYEVDLAAQLQPPSAAHWLGTDAFGRDILSLLMVGARNSILVGVIAVGIGMGVGTALGLLAAARKGWVEEAIMRLADFTFAFPALLLGHHAHRRVRGRHRQLHHRHWHLLHPDVCAGHAGVGQRRVGARIHPGCPCLRQGALAHHAGACAAQHPLGADRAGHASSLRWPSWPKRRCRTWGWARSGQSPRGAAC